MTVLENMAVAIAVSEMRRTGWPETFIVGIEKDARSVAVAVQTYGDMARAALTAIRDLDSGDINSGGLAALVAGKRALYSCSADPELSDARGCFHAMIDEILKGEG